MSGFFNSLKSLASGAANAAGSASKYADDDDEEGEDTRIRFSLTPQPGESGFTQWLDAMKMVARLSGGIPQEFRKRLWLTLAERHLEQRGVDWKQAEKLCFNEWTNPDDEELGIQIVKDLHRTGCSLFCGAAGRDNQAVLRRVLLGFARWNKSVGYCQGLNVLAALILQVTDRAEASAVKVMIYLIEGVLPEGYFADNLRGLSIDMAVFRDLLRMRLPKLSRHLEALQCDNKDKATGSSYEPPLTNVFTMQWFLTLFCHCLPQDAVLRVWDLIFLEGDEVLLRTALAIWEGISDRIMTVTSADEFYSIMGVLTREMLEFTDTNHLIKTIVSMGPLHGVTDLREKHRYNITPWARRLSDDEDTDTEDEERLAVAAAAAAMFDVPQRFKKAASGTLQTIHAVGDRDRLALDITTLKQQYAKLRERQRQTHIILSAARQTMLPSSTSQAMNHLLVGKSALVSSKTRQLGPPPGSIPPKTRLTSMHSPRSQIKREKQGVTLHWKDTKKLKETRNEPAITDEVESESLEDIPISLKSSRRSSTDSDSDSTSTELCDEPDRFSDSEEPTSTSDYVIATDDEKSPRLGSSPITGGTPIRSPRDTTKIYSSNSKNDDIETEETSSSIAKITDQIRRLSAGEDKHSVIACSLLQMEDKSIDTKVMQQDNLSAHSRGINNMVDEDNSTSPECHDLLRGINVELDAKFDSTAALDTTYNTIKDENLSSLENENTKQISEVSDEIKKVNDNSIDCTSKRKDNIELMYSSCSFDIPKNYELEFPSKLPIAIRSNTIETSTLYQSNHESESTKIDNTESFYCPRSYVIGHLPISPIVEPKINKLADSKPWTDPIMSLNEEIKISSKIDYHTSALNIYQDKKKSPKTPESSISFSSGETMGPDSKVSSMATTPHTPIRSESCKFGEKSGRSSISSDSKTLTLASMDSDAGHSRSKVESRSDITRPSFEQSTPSTPISTDSLKNKTDLSPSKLIISSSSDSYNSVGKVKYSERSFSSGLQSPISANSIKYVPSYRGQENLSESPRDIGSATSPFFPITSPIVKSPSPNRVLNKSKNIIDHNDISSERSSSSKESTKSAVYLFEESPSLSRGVDAKLIKNTDDYDSGRSFEAELAATLSSQRSKNERETIIVNINETVDMKVLNEDILLETDTISPLPPGRYEARSTLLNASNNSANSDEVYSNKRHESKVFERSYSSLEKRINKMKLSTSTEDFLATKKRSSDILADLRHLEANSTATISISDTCMTKTTGYDWEELKNLEARRQDNFSDSANKFSKYRLDIPSISVSTDGRKGYVVEPKIQIDENSDSLLKNYTQTKSNNGTDDDRESKLGVWTKVKPRKKAENGRRSSSDRALKIIQENSAILHKILTCQAKKCLPDLEEITKEITISPINEEISKIFSPILEKMGLNEDEINEELARINFKDFDQMTITSGSEFDAKINDELCKLSLIDDNDEVSHLDVDDMIAGDYLDTREALIDKQINEELSKLLANYEQASPISQSLRDKGSSSQNPSEIDGLDLSSISTNVFSYKSSNDSIETKSDVGSIQDSVIQSEKFSQYTESVPNYVSTTKYELQNLSPRSDIDIYRELEKLDKISSARVFPLAPNVTKKLISPNAYTGESQSFTEVPISTEFSTIPEKPYETPLKSPHSIYKPYEFPMSRISPLKTSNNPFSVRPYEATLESGNFNEHSITNAARSYELEAKRQILSKETLEFRVRYEDETLPIQQICEDGLSLEPYQTDLPDLDRGASYYTEESPITLKRLTMDSEKALTTAVVSPLEYSYDKPDAYMAKYTGVSPDNYGYPKSTVATNYDRQNYQLTDVEPEIGSYMSLRRRDSHSLSPNYEFTGQDYISSISTYAAKLSPTLEATGPIEPISQPQFTEKLGVMKFTEVSDTVAYRKASMTLDSLDCSSRNLRFNNTPSPKTQFSPFPVRNTTRRPKELGLKLGLYSSTSPGSSQSKRS